MKLYETLENQLKNEPNFVNDSGELKKWVVINKTQNFDAELLELLLENKELKEKFFVDVNGTLVFNQNLFVQFLEQKNYLNDSYTQYKNKVGLTIDGKYMKQRNEVALVWPFKDCVLEGGQSREEDKREEIFFNETLAQDEISQLLDPKILSNARTYTAEGEQTFTSFTRNAELNKKNGLPENTISDNLIIKGNNLLALHSLKKAFAGRVKLIYIDPPYNTGSDSFHYNDSFNHSSWLTFMKNRLQVAKEMLRNDGAILVQCDDYEQAYVKVLLDEVFGAENFDITLYVQVRFGNKTLNEDNDYQKLIEHIHVYKKPNFKPNKQVAPYSLDKFCWNVVEKTKGTKVSLGGKNVIIFKHGEYDIVKVAASKNGLKETWATGSLANQGGSAAEFFRLYLEKRKSVDGLGTMYKVIDMGTKGDGLGFRYITGPKKETATKGKFYSGLPLKKIDPVNSGMLNKTVPVQNFFTETDIYDDNFMDMKEAFGNCRTQGSVTFNSGKKPEQLIANIISLTTNEGDIVLDYHLGSGTTAAVAHKMNRRYIGVEQMDYIENLVITRLKTVIGGDQSGISSKCHWQGGGSFTYFELKKYNQIFIEKIEEANDSKELLDTWAQMKEKSFLNYNVDIKKQDEHIEEFKALSLIEQKRHLFEILDKNQLYVNLSSLNDKDFNCTDEEKTLTNDFYQIKK